MTSTLSLKHLIRFFIALVVSFSLNIHASEELEKVSLQLDWKYQFEFAGFIMAKEKGFYKDVGLDVNLIEYEEGVDIIDSVLSKKNNYGIYNSSIVISDGKLKPTILMATYYQKSPLIYVTSPDIKHPSDLVGKKIMGTTDELKYSSLALMLEHFFVNTSNAKFYEHSFNINDFIDRKVDAISVFRTNQVFELDQNNINYSIMDPADYGFSMSAVNLFTSYSEALGYPDRSRNFINASNKGWAYALAHPEETIKLIYDKYSKDKSLEALAYEAEITKEMMLLDFFDIGATNKELSLRAVKQLRYSGLLANTEKLGTFIFNDALHEFGQAVNFTDEQKLYLQNKKEITMCVDPDWMPFEAIKDNIHIGITADVISHFKEQLPIPIKLLQTKDWEESLTKAEKRQCDILSLASDTPERSKYMNFTTPYIDLPIVLATKMDTFFINNIAEVKEKKLGIVKGYAIAETLRSDIPDINIIDVESISDGLARVESGELFGYIDNLMVISNSIQKDFTGVLKVSSRLDSNVRLAIGSRNDEPQLNDIFNVLVKNINQSELQAIYNKWVAVKQEPEFDYSYIWQLLAVMFLILSGYIFHYLRLIKLNRSLLMLSTTDKLTGLYNRVKTDEVLTEIKQNIDRYGIKASILLLDIDLFKGVNDKYGHLTGDKVLIELSNIIRNNTRTTDYASRWGGEEFLVICPNLDEQGSTELAEKLLVKVSDYTFPEVKKITVSIGVSQLSKNIDIEASIKNADIALYKAKENGRNRVVVI